ncbi:MAG: tetratricopeptide repeat protein, partial [candidate division Zixibacteria bacterium]|nr:tetratricopeptide repeat protein [candidate division Zixibacteria bacterium]
MTQAGRIFAYVLAALLLCAAVGVAQDAPPPDRGRLRVMEKPAVQLMSPAVEQAQQLLLMGQYDRAAALLERELEKDPANSTILALLSVCYENQGDYARLLILLNRRAAVEPPDVNLFMEIGQVYLWNGQTDSARYCFLRAARMSDGRPPILTRVTEAYQKLSHYSLEKEFIDSARVWFKNPVLLAGPMGDALAGQTDYAG